MDEVTVDQPALAGSDFSQVTDQVNPPSITVEEFVHNDLDPRDRWNTSVYASDLQKRSRPEEMEAFPTLGQTSENLFVD